MMVRLRGMGFGNWMGRETGRRKMEETGMGREIQTGMVEMEKETGTQ